MYQNKFVVAIKVGGKILREFGDVVHIPFGSEYSILVKNLNSVRTKFRISIDGQDVTEGTWIVVPANGQSEIERFIKDQNWTSGRRFRFIERTGDIEAHRGIKAEDGLVRVEYQTETPPITITWNPQPQPWPWRPYYQSGQFTNQAVGSISSSVLPDQNLSLTASNFAGSLTKSTEPANPRDVLRSRRLTPEVAFANDNGITVAGSQSKQRFVSTTDFQTTGTTEVIVLRLKGATDEPVLVSTKIECPSCGKRSKSYAEFCSRCGTALRNS